MIRLSMGFAAASWAIPNALSQTVAAGASDGYGLDVDLSVATLVSLNPDRIGETSGTAPPVYNQVTTGVPINLSAGVPLVLNLAAISGTAGSTAVSDVDGNSGSRSTRASAKVEALSLEVGDLPLVGSLVSLSADAIESSSTVSGASATLAATSKVSLANLNLKVLGTAITLPVNLDNVAPNTALQINIPAAAGMTIVLNESVTTGNSVDGYSISTNAIRIKLNAVNLGLVNVLNGDIIIGHSEASQGVDSDGDGLLNAADADGDGDGISNAVEIANAGANGDSDGDGIQDIRDLDSDNDGINDVFEAGGKDANGDGLQDASGDGNADEDKDGLVDSVDPSDNVAGGGKGTALLIPDTDGDLSPNYVDSDSDNDTIPDLVENGGAAADANNDAIADGTDADGDGLVSSVDGAPNVYGDLGDVPPLDSDGDGTPNYLDPTSAGPGALDIVQNGNGNLDTNGDGKVDNATDTDGDGIPDAVDDKLTGPGGESFDLTTFAEWQATQFPGVTDPSIIGPKANPDGDGFSNAVEFAFGSNPKVASSVPSIVRGAGTPAGTVTLSGTRDPNAYALVAAEVSRDLAKWFDAPTITGLSVNSASEIAAGINRTQGPTGDPNKGFIRFRVQVP